MAEAERLQHSALDHAQRAGTRPGHAFQKAAAVNAVMVVIELDDVGVGFHRLPR